MPPFVYCDKHYQKEKTKHKTSSIYLYSFKQTPDKKTLLAIKLSSKSKVKNTKFSFGCFTHTYIHLYTYIYLIEDKNTLSLKYIHTYIACYLVVY